MTKYYSSKLCQIKKTLFRRYSYIPLNIIKRSLIVSDKVQIPYFLQYAKTFEQKRDFERHSFTHTGDNTYQCTQYNRIFAQKSDFKRHSMTHTREKPHQCIQCAKKFTRKVILGNIL